MPERPADFVPIDYLRWARRHMGRVRCDLARSNVRDLAPDEFGPIPADLRLAAGADGAVTELRDLLAARYGVGPERVLVTAGATMGLFVAVSALVPPGGEMIVESPRYEPLGRLAALRGAAVKTLERAPERRFEVDLESLERTIGRRTSAVLITNLHNPSGCAVDPERLATIGKIAREHEVPVIVDEVYLDAVARPGHRPACAVGPNMISISSLTKVCGLGGLRIGWVVAPPETIERLDAVLDYPGGWPSVPAQHLAAAAVRRMQALVDRCRRIAADNAARARAWAAGRTDVAWMEPDGGTLSLLKLPPGADAQALSRLLHEQYATLVVPGDFFGLPGYLRLSLGTNAESFAEGLANVGRGLDEFKRRWR